MAHRQVLLHEHWLTTKITPNRTYLFSCRASGTYRTISVDTFVQEELVDTLHETWSSFLCLFLCLHLDLNLGFPCWCYEIVAVKVRVYPHKGIHEHVDEAYGDHRKIQHPLCGGERIESCANREVQLISPTF